MVSEVTQPGIAEAHRAATAHHRSTQLARTVTPIAYLVLAFAMFSDAWRSPTTHYIGAIPDALQSVWFLSVTAHALAAHQSLLFTHLIDAPSGVNLMWNTPTLLLGVLAAPATLTLGPVFAFNLLVTLSLWASAWAGFVCIAHFVRSTPAAVIGGLLYGFSPYAIAHALGHLSLVFMAYPPLVLLLFDEIVIRQRRRWWVSGGALGLLTAAQLFVMEEVIVAVAIAFAVGLVVAGVQWRAQMAAHSRHIIAALAAAVVVVALLAGWAVWFQVAGPQAPPGLVEVGGHTSSDALAFVTPTDNQLVSPAFAQQTAAHFAAQTTGQDSYLGVPLLVLLGVIVWKFWKEPLVRLCVITGATLVILSMGPALDVDGRVLGIPLPWAVFQHLPVAGNLVPVRLTGYAFLFVAALVAFAIAQVARAPRRLAVTLAVLIVVFVISWIPVAPRPVLALPQPASLPQPIAAQIPDGTAVLFAPYPSVATVDAMWYQAEDSFRFTLVDGYAYYPHSHLPLDSAIASGTRAAIGAAIDMLASASARGGVIRRYADLGISAIVVPPGRAAGAYTDLFTALFQAPPVSAAGFSVWRVPRLAGT